MTYVLVFTFYSGDDLVGVDVKPATKDTKPIDLFALEVVAPSNSDLCVVSLSALESVDIDWIVPFKMVGINDQEN